MKFYYRIKRWMGERHGEPCDLLAQSRTNGNRLIRFADGYCAIVPFYAIRVRKK